MFNAAKRISNEKIDCWSVFTPLANKTPNCQNLGQGFPSAPPPNYILQMPPISGNQYSPPSGIPDLKAAVSKYYEKWSITGDVCVTAGANEAIFATLAAYINPGDEVIVFEPFFDQYLSNITFQGGVVKAVALEPPNWTIPYQQLRDAITDKTKIIIFNSPHNPSGKVFRYEEMLELSQIVKNKNILVIADEVYAELTFDQPHIPFANLPDMYDYTITIGSAGKTFSATGWRIGWAIGKPSIIHNMLLAHTRIVFCPNQPLQHLVVKGLTEEPNHNYFQKQRDNYKGKRDLLMKCFDDLKMKYTPAQGAYFLLVDTSNLKIPQEDIDEIPEDIQSRGRDWLVCYWMTTKIGVACIPPSSFYLQNHAHIGEKYIRFCFCKDDDIINKAITKLKELSKYI